MPIKFRRRPSLIIILKMLIILLFDDIYQVILLDIVLWHHRLSTLHQGNTTKHIPTEAEVSLAGGVWAMTSAKRDKLAELKLALPDSPDGLQNLDSAATKEEILDLYLTDGLKLIAKITDLQSNSSAEEMNVTTATNNNIIDEFNTWLNSQHHSSLPDAVSQTELESKLQIVSAKINSLLERIPSDRCLRHVT